MFETILFSKHILRGYSKLMPSRWASGSAGLKGFNGNWKISTDSGWPVRGILSPPPAYRSSFSAKSKSGTLGFNWFQAGKFYGLDFRPAQVLVLEVGQAGGVFRFDASCSSSPDNPDSKRVVFFRINGWGDFEIWIFGHLPRGNTRSDRLVLLQVKADWAGVACN